MKALALVLSTLTLMACAQVRGDTGGAAGAIAVTINPFCHLLCFGYGPKRDDLTPMRQ